jgi:hypothetical protein
MKRFAPAFVPRRFAESAVLGFPQVEHLSKTANQDIAPTTHLKQHFLCCYRHTDAVTDFVEHLLGLSNILICPCH